MNRGADAAHQQASYRHTQPTGTQALERIVGQSAWCRQTRNDIQEIAGHASRVLITGPTGTGKELIARAIHSTSCRGKNSFIPVDCAAIVPTLFPSHMFGHIKGAFTGAQYAAMGSFRAADGGTLFLDEIGELRLDLQAQLLRALQEKVVIPVGGAHSVPIDVRVIAATNRDLATEVSHGRFREDLYYRLNVVSLRTVPLHDRPEDVEPIAIQVLDRLVKQHGLPAKRLTPATIKLLRSQIWNGNVRELENLLERLVIFCRDAEIDAVACHQLLAPSVASGFRQPPPVPVDDYHPVQASEILACMAASETQDDDWVGLAELERFHIIQTLEHVCFNQTHAANLLGVSRRVLSGKLAKHAIDRSTSHVGRPAAPLPTKPR